MSFSSKHFPSIEFSLSPLFPLLLTLYHCHPWFWLLLYTDILSEHCCVILVISRLQFPCPVLELLLTPPPSVCSCFLSKFSPMHVGLSWWIGVKSANLLDDHHIALLISARKQRLNGV